MSGVYEYEVVLCMRICVGCVCVLCVVCCVCCVRCVMCVYMCVLRGECQNTLYRCWQMREATYFTQHMQSQKKQVIIYRVSVKLNAPQHQQHSPPSVWMSLYTQVVRLSRSINIVNTEGILVPIINSILIKRTRTSLSSYRIDREVSLREP